MRLGNCRLIQKSHCHRSWLVMSQLSHYYSVIAAGANLIPLDHARISWHWPPISHHALLCLLIYCLVRSRPWIKDSFTCSKNNSDTPQLIAKNCGNVSRIILWYVCNVIVFLSTPCLTLYAVLPRSINARHEFGEAFPVKIRRSFFHLIALWKLSAISTLGLRVGLFVKPVPVQFDRLPRRSRSFSRSKTF